MQIHVQDVLSLMGHSIFRSLPPKPNTWNFPQIKRLQLDAKIMGKEYYVKGIMSSVTTQLHVTVMYRTTL